MKAKRARILPKPALEASDFESAAERISARIREAHMPHGTVMDPVFASPDSSDIVSYTHAGDSAIWTGHYLAAECFRYSVTKSPEALANVQAALDGIQQLIDATNMDVLARVTIPNDSPYAAAIQKEEGNHGIFPCSASDNPSFWIGNTTRDQYSGVMFGLGVAWELVKEAQPQVNSLISRLVGYLIDHIWTVRMPDGQISTVFVQRPDQQLAFSQIARKANSKDFGSNYKLLRFNLSGITVVPLAYEVLDDHHSYFKFNLDTINMYSLIHFEDDSSAFKKVYQKAYAVLRRTTDDHQNPHFNMIDRAIQGPSASRDSQTVEYLRSWLSRSTRDAFVDLRGTLNACGDDRACDVIPIPQRPNTDFLWQRSPFLLFGGGVGLVEGAGIDFILPYWMARYYQLPV